MSTSVLVTASGSGGCGHGLGGARASQEPVRVAPSARSPLTENPHCQLAPLARMALLYKDGKAQALMIALAVLKSVAARPRAAVHRGASRARARALASALTMSRAFDNSM